MVISEEQAAPGRPVLRVWGSGHPPLLDEFQRYFPDAVLDAIVQNITLTRPLRTLARRGDFDTIDELNRWMGIAFYMGVGLLSSAMDVPTTNSSEREKGSVSTCTHTLPSSVLNTVRENK